MRRISLLLITLLLLGTTALAEQAKKVDVFVTGWCPYCRKLEQFLKQSNIEYTRHDVEADARANKEFNKLGGSGVPVVRVGKDVIYGYDPAGVLAALKTKN